MVTANIVKERDGRGQIRRESEVWLCFGSVPIVLECFLSHS